MRMQNYLFRAKRLTPHVSGDWIKGNLIENSYGEFIQVEGVAETDSGPEPAISEIPIDKETVGQFIGLKDRNHKMVFEGDILHSETLDGNHHYGIVGFKNGYYCLWVNRPNTDHWGWTALFHHNENGILIAHNVVGNQFDNKELVKNYPSPY